MKGFAILAFISSLAWSVHGTCEMVGSPIKDESGRDITVSTNALNWNDAQQCCTAQGQGFNLWMPKTTQEVDSFMPEIRKIHDLTSFWVGANDFETEGVWKFIDGTPVPSDLFMPGEPNDNQGTEDCPELLKVWGDRINDLSCHYGKPFVCQGPLPPTTTTTPTTTTYPSTTPVPTTTTTTPTCETVGATLTDDSGRDISISTKALNWNNAQHCCNTQGQGFNLWMPKTTQEVDSLMPEIRKVHDLTSFWIGANDFETEGDWKFIDGTPVPSDLFMPGEPNDSQGTEDCPELLKVWGDRINDLSCHYGKPYVCQGPLPPTTTTTPTTTTYPSTTPVFTTPMVTTPVATTPIATTPVTTAIPTPPPASCVMAETILTDESGRNITISTKALQWQIARQCCMQQGQGYDLWMPKSTAEASDLMPRIGEVRAFDYLWIGANDFEEEGDWKFNDGTPVPQDFFGPGEPNQHEGVEEDCAELIKPWGYKINDLPCEREKDFVCQGPLPQHPPENCEIEAPLTEVYFVRTNSAFYKRIQISDKSLEWAEAKEYCESKGGQLWMPKTRRELNTIMPAINQIEQLEDLWVGAKRVKPGGKIKFIDGTRVRKNMYNPGEPNNYTGDEDCVEVKQIQWKNHQPGLNDVRCYLKRRFVCEGHLPTTNAASTTARTTARTTTRTTTTTVTTTVTTTTTTTTTSTTTSTTTTTTGIITTSTRTSTRRTSTMSTNTPYPPPDPLQIYRPIFAQLWNQLMGR